MGQIEQQKPNPPFISMGLNADDICKILAKKIENLLGPDKSGLFQSIHIADWLKQTKLIIVTPVAEKPGFFNIQISMPGFTQENFPEIGGKYPGQIYIAGVVDKMPEITVSEEKTKKGTEIRMSINWGGERIRFTNGSSVPNADTFIFAITGDKANISTRKVTVEYIGFSIKHKPDGTLIGTLPGTDIPATTPEEAKITGHNKISDHYNIKFR